MTAASSCLPVTRYFTLIGLLLVWAATAIADVVDINEYTERLSLSQRMQFLEDPTGKLTYDDLGHSPLNYKWQHTPAEVINLGYTHSAYWFKVELKNYSGFIQNRLVEIAYPVLDHIKVYLVSNQGNRNTYTLGDKQPFELRPIKHRNFVLPLNFNPKESWQLYFRVQTSSSMQLPIFLWQKHAFLEYAQDNIFSLGLYYGAMLIMILYNLFVYFSIREINFLYYVMYITCMALFLASLNGISFQFLWPHGIWWNDQSIIICLAGVTLFAMLFARNFTSLPGNNPILSGLLLTFAGFAAGIILFAVFVPYSVMILIVILTSVMAIIIAIFAGILRWLEGDSASRYFAIAWSSLMFGAIILAGNKLGVLPRNWFTENATLLGSAIEVVLLSFALAVRLNTEKKNRFQAQEIALQNERIARLAEAEALEQEKKTRLAQAKTLEIQQRANEMLEQRVKERTQELEAANTKLEKLSNTDGLTGIKNRRYFDITYLYEYKRAIRNQNSIALLIIDIDHFKRFNDNYGHMTGDKCLKIVADTISSQLGRTYDLLARYGGEEFAVLLPNASPEGAVHMAEKIRLGIGNYPFQVKNRPVQITVSIGAAVEIPKNVNRASQLIANADEALYQSKINGRNKMTLFGQDGSHVQNISMQTA